MRLRAFLDVVIPTALVAGGAVFAASAWFAFASARAYLDSSNRIERLHDAQRLLTAVRPSTRAGAQDHRPTPDGGRHDSPDTRLPASSDVPRQLAEARRLLAETPGRSPDSGLSGAGLRPRADALRHGGAVTDRKLPDTAALSDAGGDGTGPALRIASDVAQLRRAIAKEIDAESSRALERRAEAAQSAAPVAVMLMLLTIAGASLLVWQERERRRLRRQLDEDARHDPLTGLPDHRFFNAWLGYALAQTRRDDAHLGLLCIGLDGLPHPDDPHGGQERARVLAEIGSRFRATARDSDVLVRQGSDGFMLAVPGTRDAREIDALARRLIASLRDPERPPIFDLPVSASIGVAIYPHDAGDVAGLLAAAADAMYVARRSGRNRAVFSAVAAFA